VVDTCWSIDRTARSYISCTNYWYNIYSCYNTTSAISRARSISQNDFSLLSLRPRRSSSVPKIPYARFASSTTTTGSFSRAANKCLSPSTSSTFVSVSSLSWQSNRDYRTRVRSTIKWLRNKGVFHTHGPQALYCVHGRTIRLQGNHAALRAGHCRSHLLHVKGRRTFKSDAVLSHSWPFSIHKVGRFRRSKER
jgi:hypothetical protein